jgi:hypothetical protein
MLHSNTAIPHRKRISLQNKMTSLGSCGNLVSIELESSCSNSLRSSASFPDDLERLGDEPKLKPNRKSTGNISSFRIEGNHENQIEALPLKKHLLKKKTKLSLEILKNLHSAYAVATYAGPVIDGSVNSVLPLNEQEILELYPSDEDEDFDLYLGEGSAQDETLKFTHCYKNPFYDPNAPVVTQYVLLSVEEIQIIEEVTQKLLKRGESLNYVLANQIEQTVRENHKTKGNQYEHCTKQEMKQLIPKDQLPITGYNISKCSRDWKTQLKRLKEKSLTLGFTSCASETRQGYMKDWKYSLQILATLNRFKGLVQ